MRQPFHDLAEKGRVNIGPFGTERHQPFGHFLIRCPTSRLSIIACDAEKGWEHVSACVIDPQADSPTRTPTWEEMCFLKNLFFTEDECVVQFHPAKKDYINDHPFVLHLWKQVNAEFPMPDSTLV